MMDLGVEEEDAATIAGEAAASSSTNAMADRPAPPEGVGTIAGTVDAAWATPVVAGQGPAVPPSAIIPHNDESCQVLAGLFNDESCQVPAGLFNSAASPAEQRQALRQREDAAQTEMAHVQAAAAMLPGSADLAAKVTTKQAADPFCGPAETLPTLPAGIPNPYGGVALAVELAKHPSGLMPVLHNTACTFDLGCPIRIHQLVTWARNAERNAPLKSALIRMRDPKATAQVFKSGKVVVTGASNLGHMHTASRKVAWIVRRVGFTDAKFTNYRVTNTVATVNVKFPVSLQALHERCFANADYDPERFSALIYKMATPKKMSLKVFASGMVTIEGATNLAMLYAAFEKLYPEIEACKLSTAK